MSGTYFLIIDPQVDFCAPEGKLSFPGADAEMSRLAGVVNRLCPFIDKLFVSLDTHHICDIAHPIFWCDADGNAPKPLTLITAEDVLLGKWKARNPEDRVRALDYVQKLSTQGKNHIIWPEHCIFGTPGHAVIEPLQSALEAYEREKATGIEYIVKGLNRYTEHFSAVRAEVVDPNDPDTDRCAYWAEIFDAADRLYVAGEASSHCLGGTVRDLVAERPSIAQKMILIRDCIGCVPGFEERGAAFFADMKRAGAVEQFSTDL